MNELIPAFDFQKVVIDTWINDPFGHLGRGWIMLSGFLVAAACGLVGNFLILRRMALIGDAISHSVLAGLAQVQEDALRQLLSAGADADDHHIV